ncbi:protein of unknown function, partial [Flaviramulus basaltis]
TGDLNQYHKTTLTFDALSLSEVPATYLNYRMNVTFTAPSSATYTVPAYFAADGNASETSATSGNKWRCHFNPDETGIWSYSVSFRTGTNIAVSLNPTDGTPTSIDGDTGTFDIEATNKTGVDFRAKGKLQYIGKSTAQFDNGDYYFEMGSDSPETFLEYADFDATTPRHDYSEMASNYLSGDPTWKGGKGTGIIGAVNYLASQEANIQYIIFNNITGDGDRTYPFPNKTDYTTYDVSKLDQWQIVFDHMYNKGIALEMVLGETENSNWFEDQEGINRSNFSNSRKLYYRELIARFGYLNIVYNTGEEANWNTNGDQFTAAQIEEIAVYIQALSPYSDLISAHNGSASNFSIYPELTALSGTSALTAISIQGNYNDLKLTHDQVINIKNLAIADGTEWVVRFTEPYTSVLNPNIETWTEKSLWPSITAGSVGIHHIDGAGGDVSNDNLAQYQPYLERMKYAKNFFEDNNIPFWNMSNDDASISKGYLLSDNLENYIAFLADGGTATLDLPGSNTYSVKWFDPRNGGDLKDGSVTTINSDTNV